ncbi:MAG: hypothetical protein KDA86_05250 [Planctomycetaceae bacterium]|nr:hypothetical protein [Planctomycetaceae bacterium]MCA9109210.1 hypothetical protein [Planctomycetaceae bacterium]
MSYQQLDSDRIVETVQTLHRRMKERFPQAGLVGVCEKLLEIARQARVRSAEIARPMVWVRVLSGVVIVTLLVGFGWTISTAKMEGETLTIPEFVQVLEAGLNDLVLIGATIFFLMTMESRVKRGRALKAIHELRSIAHIIDMHQLTKDPERLLHRGKDTQSSPKRTMTQFELSRYLDYCAEMLSMTSKVAALYVQGFEDDVAVAAVNDIENLTNGMSRKIWQKLMILHTVDQIDVEKHERHKENAGA